MLHQSFAITTTYNVLNLEAKSDAKTDSTAAFLTAWSEACASTRPLIIYVPEGKFLLNNLHFKGTLVTPADYNGTNWVLFEGVDGVLIHGGVLDGQGAALWACKKSGKGCPSGATVYIRISNSRNVEIIGLTSLNSQMFHIVINGCQNVKLQGVKVMASGDSPNTDGIHVQLSMGVTILSSKISIGDDCISICNNSKNFLK
ncbi:Polygalacturonase [Handroanthus impetiginosus]|uniref:Polygalacturonase n=1 Tax=Handroanthus impetiginosus TaxID=429701 RepID=A0A2G9GQ67_9LAMI|nr:Polygalacturonase [Handroanthus impetiginosus]